MTRALVLAAAVLGVAGAGCRPDPADDELPVEVELSIAPTPPIVGPVRIVLEVRDGDGAPVDDARIQVEGTMTHAGMTAVTKRAEPRGDGRYVIEAFELTMGGDWVLLTTIRLPDGREGTRSDEIRVVSASPPGGDEAVR